MRAGLPISDSSRWAMLWLLTTASCTFTSRVPPFDAQVWGGSVPLPCRAVLTLDDAFVHYNYAIQLGDRYEYEMGDALRSGAEASVRSLCRDVVINAPNAPPLMGDIVVTPRVAAVITSPFQFGAHTERVTTVSIEWTVRDAAGNLLWVGTIDGEGQSEQGTAFNRGSSAMKRLRAATEQAFQNASLRIRDSPDVQRRLHPG